MNRKHNALEAFTEISFFNVYEILLFKFCLRSMKSIEMQFHVEEQQTER